MQSKGLTSLPVCKSPDTVYGLLQCFGNASAEKYSNCSRQAYSVALTDCSNDRRVWMDNCFLRYDNTNFSSALDTTFEPLKNGHNISSNVQGFISATSGLLLNLSREARQIADLMYRKKKKSS
ncbi:hypothetical protein SUGI_0388570 [Cryptomeria japonica]|nr:hypothetical protein SUGI_0388570 [Cryptomeria japonica]